MHNKRSLKPLYNAYNYHLNSLFFLFQSSVFTSRQTCNDSSSLTRAHLLTTPSFFRGFPHKRLREITEREDGLSGKLMVGRTVCFSISPGLQKTKRLVSYLNIFCFFFFAFQSVLCKVNQINYVQHSATEWDGKSTQAGINMKRGCKYRVLCLNVWKFNQRFFARRNVFPSCSFQTKAAYLKWYFGSQTLFLIRTKLLALLYTA